MENKLPDWQERMVEEHKELDERIVKIYKFFNTDTFENMSFLEKELLIKQHEFMKEYRKFLCYRLDFYHIEH